MLSCLAEQVKSGIEALMQGAELAQGLEASKRQTLTEALLGREPTSTRANLSE